MNIEARRSKAEYRDKKIDVSNINAVRRTHNVPYSRPVKTGGSPPNLTVGERGERWVN